jgi:hypothetical protein
MLAGLVRNNKANSTRMNKDFQEKAKKMETNHKYPSEGKCRRTPTNIHCTQTNLNS